MDSLAASHGLMQPHGKLRQRRVGRAGDAEDDAQPAESALGGGAKLAEAPAPVPSLSRAASCTGPDIVARAMNLEASMGPMAASLQPTRGVCAGTVANCAVQGGTCESGGDSSTPRAALAPFLTTPPPGVAVAYFSTTALADGGTGATVDGADVVRTSRDEQKVTAERGDANARASTSATTTTTITTTAATSSCAAASDSSASERGARGSSSCSSSGGTCAANTPVVVPVTAAASAAVEAAYDADAKAKACAKCSARWAKDGFPYVPARGSSEAKSAQFTVCDVQLHNRPHDCWLAAHGVVYDVTRFVSQHPGGSRSILRHAGQECDADFDFHSGPAQKMWNDYVVGRLAPCLAKPSVPSATSCVIQ